MGYKSNHKYLIFSDVEKSFRNQKNKSFETLMSLDKTITWDRIETILMRDYGRQIKHNLGKRIGRRAQSVVLAMNNLKDGVMKKNEQNAKLTEYEIERNKKITKVRYMVEQCFGLSHLHGDGQRARFTTMAKNHIDIWFRQVAFNIKRGFKVLKKAVSHGIVLSKWRKVPFERSKRMKTVKK